MGGGVQFLASGRCSWETGVDASERHYGHLATSPNAAKGLFDSGFLLDYHSQINYELLRIPERRLRVESSLRGETGRLFAAAMNPFARVRASITTDWLPRAQGDRDEITFRVRAGKTFGQVPFDELFMLGVERDNDLWLRGHAGTADGRKGSAPLGRDFILINADYSHVIYENGIVKLKLGPFLDSGRINDPSGLFGSRAWLWDPGVDLKLTILGGTEFIFHLRSRPARPSQRFLLCLSPLRGSRSGAAKLAKWSAPGRASLPGFRTTATTTALLNGSPHGYCGSSTQSNTHASVLKLNGCRLMLSKWS